MTPEEFIEKTESCISKGIYRLYDLSETGTIEDGGYSIFTGLVPQGEGFYSYKEVSNLNPEKRLSYYSFINHINGIPESISALLVEEGKYIRETYEGKVASMGMPSMILACAEIDGSPPPEIILLTVPGIHPRRAFETIQLAVTDMLIRCN